MEEQLGKPLVVRWREQGEVIGEARGRVEGERKVLRRQLVRRFGELSAEVEARLAAASDVEIETWADRILDAATLEEVLA